jgi:hypothetical protein
VFISDLTHLGLFGAPVVVAFLAPVPVVSAFSWACVFRWWLRFPVVGSPVSSSSLLVRGFPVVVVVRCDFPADSSLLRCGAFCSGGGVMGCGLFLCFLAWPCCICVGGLILRVWWFGGCVSGGGW